MRLISKMTLAGIVASLLIGAHPSPAHISAQAPAPAVAVSQMGYPPDSSKRVIEYDGQDTSFYLTDSAGRVVYSGALAPPLDAGGNPETCQGGQQCRIGDFSQFRTEGTYSARAGPAVSPQFQISSSVYARNASLAMEFFDAQLQQGSAYHLDLHRAQVPAFTMQADGSFIMEANMATLPLIRLASARNRSPGIFASKYFPGRDIDAHILKYVDYVEELQDASGTMDIVRGWNNNFGCGYVTPSQEMWNTTPEPCMTFMTSTSEFYTVSGFLALLEAYPSLSAARQPEVLDRALRTYNFINQRYPAESGDNAAFTGAGLFRLFDYTGNPRFLSDAYNLRAAVPTAFDAIGTTGAEFYWEEYARHKAAIGSAGFPYALNGYGPEDFLAMYIQAGQARMANGEGVYEYNNSIQFSNSRYMLSWALFAAKAAELGYAPGRDIAMRQLAFLTGANRLQSGTGAGAPESLSLIFGIGNNPRYFHSRLMGPDYEAAGGTFLNGLRYIPGWIGGAYDSNSDGIFNYNDAFSTWTFSETTNEMVALFAELSAYLAAPPAAPAMPKYTSVKDIPSRCNGTITSDTYNGGRSISCASGQESLSVTAWDKPDGINPPQWFEMYKVQQSGSGLEICLTTVCIGDNGFAKSPDFPIDALYNKVYAPMIRR